jgi:hypothetical protein
MLNLIANGFFAVLLGCAIGGIILWAMERQS